MKKISELLNLETPPNMRFLNDRARAHWALMYGVNKPLILVTGQTSDSELDCQLFTLEAYELVKPHLLVTYAVTPIDAGAASSTSIWVWTCEDVVTLLQGKVGP